MEMKTKTIKKHRFHQLTSKCTSASRVKISALICSLIILWFDRVIKNIALDNLIYTKTYPVISILKGKIGLNWFLTYNYGTAFSFIKIASGYTFYLLSALSILITVFLLGWMYTEDSKNHLNIFAISAIIGGALGNIYDRINYGFVVDFIDLYAGTWHWPIFNLADIAVSLGVVLLAYTQLIRKDD